MGRNTRATVREAAIYKEKIQSDYYQRLVALAHNSVSLITKYELPKRYLLRVLFGRGFIAFDKQTELFLPANGYMLNAYGLPKLYTLVSYTGMVLQRKADEVVILRASDNVHPIRDTLKLYASRLAEIEMSIHTNLINTRTTGIIEVDDESQLLTLSNIEEGRRIGASVVYVNKALGVTGGAISSLPLHHEYVSNELQELKYNIWQEALSYIGVGSINRDKRERVQNSEVNASQFYARDALSVLVDTFNYDAEYGNLDIRLAPNTAIFESDQNDAENNIVLPNTEA